MKVFQLHLGSLQVAVMVKKLKPAEDLLMGAAHKRRDVTGLEEPMLCNQENNLSIPRCDIECGQIASMFEPWKPWHPPSLRGFRGRRQARETAFSGNS
jgi:hypothetical protein